MLILLSAFDTILSLYSNTNSPYNIDTEYVYIIDVHQPTFRVSGQGQFSRQKVRSNQSSVLTHGSRSTELGWAYKERLTFD